MTATFLRGETETAPRTAIEMVFASDPADVGG
jgi:hypothetical protein